MINSYLQLAQSQRIREEVAGPIKKENQEEAADIEFVESSQANIDGMTDGTAHLPSKKLKRGNWKRVNNYKH